MVICKLEAYFVGNNKFDFLDLNLKDLKWDGR